LYDEFLVRFDAVMRLGHGASNLLFVGVRLKRESKRASSVSRQRRMNEFVRHLGLIVVKWKL
jgi:hypothetical protein